MLLIEPVRFNSIYGRGPVCARYTQLIRVDLARSNGWPIVSIISFTGPCKRQLRNELLSDTARTFSVAVKKARIVCEEGLYPEEGGRRRRSRRGID